MKKFKPTVSQKPKRYGAPPKKSHPWRSFGYGKTKVERKDCGQLQ